MTKPRLVYFHYRYESIPQFVIGHTKEHQKCLAEFFDVTLVDYDCDYEEICEKYQPDLALFESGLAFSSCRRPNIFNPHACSNVPKIGFLHSDGFCESRPGFLSDMDRLGVTTFFAIAATAPAYMPEIADQLYIWPNFIDSDRFYDYGESKTVPVLFTGNNNELYPWRRRLYKEISKHYPTMICPHPGYDPSGRAGILGESYARLLNSAMFVPACGTVALELVRKHFEIPGCRACLITQKSAVLECAGFVDMENCVFADEHTILDKLEHLFGHPDQLQKIIDKGYDLVQSRHTLRHRDQMVQWLTLYKGLKDGEKIIQEGPFGPLRVAPSNAPPAPLPADLGGIHLRLLKQGNHHLQSGLYEDAERAFRTCLNYHRLMPEPQFGLALCDLYRGNAHAALGKIMQLVQFTLAEYQAGDPDPVEWAYLLVCLLCCGKLAEAVERSKEFACLRHRELNRVRNLVAVLQNRDVLRAVAADDGSADRISVHSLANFTVREWVNNICALLKVCGQRDLAERAKKCALEIEKREDASPWHSAKGRARPNSSSNLQPSRKLLRMFNRRSTYSRWNQRVKAVGKSVMRSLEGRWGCFLPYNLSIRRDDELCRGVESIMGEDINTVLMVGADARQWITEAAIAGLGKNKARTLCIAINSKANDASHQPPATNNIAWHSLSGSTQEMVREFERAIAEFKSGAGITSFDVIVVDGSELPQNDRLIEVVVSHLEGAKYLVFEDTNSPVVFALHEQLNEADYCLVEGNPMLRQGYAIFQRKVSAVLV